MPFFFNFPCCLFLFYYHSNFFERAERAKKRLLYTLRLFFFPLFHFSFVFIWIFSALKHINFHHTNMIISTLELKCRIYMIDAIHEEPLFKLEWPNQVLYINMKKKSCFHSLHFFWKFWICFVGGKFQP